MDSERWKNSIEQRTEKGIWQQLYQFPLIETPTAVSAKKEFLSHPELSKKIDTP